MSGINDSYFRVEGCFPLLITLVLFIFSIVGIVATIQHFT